MTRNTIPATCRWVTALVAAAFLISIEAGPQPRIPIPI